VRAATGAHAPTFWPRAMDIIMSMTEIPVWIISSG
jgi:hypothetical protein